MGLQKAVTVEPETVYIFHTKGQGNLSNVENRRSPNLPSQGLMFSAFDFQNDLEFKSVGF